MAFSPGVNVLWGDNAQGKSNILEGIYYCARGRSFRGVSDKLLIQDGEDAAHVAVSFRREDRLYPGSLSYTFLRNAKKRMERDGYAVTSPRDMVGELSAVLFTPQHLSLVNGAPAERRAFLDVAIATAYPPYLAALAAYKKNLEERSALLRITNGEGGRPDIGLFDTYAYAMAEAGAVIAAIRQDFIRRVGILAARQMEAISGGADTLSLSYRPCGADAAPAVRSLDDPELGAGPEGDTAYRDELYLALTDDLYHELSAKTTLYGPHRDDMSISLGEHPAKQFASQGQTRSIALALKLAEGAISTLLTGERPIYLLDDVLSELDESRRGYLLSKLQNEQLILTSCEPGFSGAEESLFPDVRKFRIQKGAVVGVT